MQVTRLALLNRGTSERNVERIEMLETELSSLRVREYEAEEARRQLASDYEALQAEHNTMLQLMSEERTEAEQRQEELTDQLKQAEQYALELHAEIDEAKRMNSDLRRASEQQQSSLNTRILELQTQLVGSQRGAHQIEELHAQINTLHTQLHEHRTFADTLVQQREAAVQEQHTLLDQLTRCQQERSSLSAQIFELQQARDRYRQEIIELKAVGVRASSADAAAQTDRDTLGQELHRLTLEHLELQSEYGSLRKESARLRELMGSQALPHHDAHSEDEQETASIATSLSIHFDSPQTDMSLQYAQLQATYTAALDELNQAREELAVDKDRLARSEAEASRISSEHERSCNELQAMKKLLHQARSDMDEIRVTHSQHIAELQADHARQIEKYRQLLLEKEQKATEQRHDFTRVQAQLVQQQEDMAKQLQEAMRSRQEEELQQEVDLLREQYSQARQELKDTKARCKALQDQLLLQEKTIQEARSLQQQLQARLDESDHRCSIATRSQQEQAAKLEETQQLLEQKVKQLPKLDEMLIEWQHKYDSASTQAEELRAELQRCSAEKRSAEETSEAITMYHQQLLLEHESVLQELLHTKTQLEQQQQQVNEITESRANVCEELAEVQARQQELLNEAQAHDLEKSYASQQIEQLQNALGELTHKATILQQKYDDDQVRIAGLENDVRVSTQRYNDYSAACAIELAEWKTLAEDRQRGLNKLQEQLQSQLQTDATLIEKVRKYQEELATAHNKLAALQNVHTQREQMLEQLQQCQADKVLLKKELQQSQDIVRELTTQLQTSAHMYHEAQQSDAATQPNGDSLLAAELDQLRRECTSVEAELHDTRISLQRCSNERVDLEAQLQDQLQQNAILAARVNQECSRSDGLAEELREAQQQLVDSAEHRENIIRQVEILEKRLQEHTYPPDLERQNEQLQSELRSTNAMVKHLQQRVKEHENTIGSLRHQVALAREHEAQSAQALQEWMSKYEQLRLRAAPTSKVSELSRQNEAYKQRLEELHQEVSALRTANIQQKQMLIMSKSPKASAAPSPAVNSPRAPRQDVTESTEPTRDTSTSPQRRLSIASMTSTDSTSRRRLSLRPTKLQPRHHVDSVHRFDASRTLNRLPAKAVAFRGHTDIVTRALFDPSTPQRYVSASRDATVRVWNSSGVSIKSLSGHRGPITELIAVDDERPLFATASEDGSVRVWNIQQSQCMRVFSGHHTGKIMSCVSTGEYLVIGNEDTTICVYDIESGQLLRRLQGHKKHVAALALEQKESGDSVVIASGSADMSVKLWDVRRAGEGAGCVATLSGHAGAVTQLCFVGDKLVSGGDDCAAHAWSLAELTTAAHSFTGLRGKVTGLVSGGSNWAVVGCLNAVHTVDVDTGDMVHVTEPYNWVVSCVAVGSSIIASGCADSNVVVSELATGQPLGSLEGHKLGVRSVAVQDNYVLSASDDATVRLWQWS